MKKRKEGRMALDDLPDEAAPLLPSSPLKLFAIFRATRQKKYVFIKRKEVLLPFISRQMTDRGRDAQNSCEDSPAADQLSSADVAVSASLDHLSPVPPLPGGPGRRQRGGDGVVRTGVPGAVHLLQELEEQEEGFHGEEAAPLLELDFACSP